MIYEHPHRGSHTYRIVGECVNVARKMKTKQDSQSSVLYEAPWLGQMP